MITVDYRNYLEQQSEWAESLRRVARSLEPGPASELGEDAAAALRRMIRFSFFAGKNGGSQVRFLPYTIARSIQKDRSATRTRKDWFSPHLSPKALMFAHSRNYLSPTAIAHSDTMD